MGVGGRYQTIHVDLSGSSLTPLSLLAEDADLSREDEDAFDLTGFQAPPSWSACKSRLSPCCLPAIASGELAVLDDFAVDPNEAKAPEPSPKADDAATEGEETVEERGDMALNGFERGCEPSKRPAERPRDESNFPAPSLLSELEVDRESFAELQMVKRRKSKERLILVLPTLEYMTIQKSNRRDWGWPNLCEEGSGIGHLLRSSSP